MYSSQNGAISQVLITSSPPSATAARPWVHGERSVTPRLMTCAAATATTSSSNGMATKCGWRSLKKAVKNGNSLMPSGWVLGMTREDENHHSPLVGGHTPTLMPSPNVLMPSTPPAPGVSSPRETRNSNKARRLPQNSPSRVPSVGPTADQIG